MLGKYQQGRYMTDAQNTTPDIEPEEGANQEPSAPAPKGTSGRASFRGARRTLTEDELTQPAVRFMLLDEIERLDERVSKLETFEDKFHIADKQAAVLNEKLTAVISIEVIHSTCMAIGAALLGFAPSMWASDDQPNGYILLGLGALLVLGGIIAKAVKVK